MKHGAEQSTVFRAPFCELSVCIGGAWKVPIAVDGTASSCIREGILVTHVVISVGWMVFTGSGKIGAKKLERKVDTAKSTNSPSPFHPPPITAFCLPLPSAVPFCFSSPSVPFLQQTTTVSDTTREAQRPCYAPFFASQPSTGSLVFSIPSSPCAFLGWSHLFESLRQRLLLVKKCSAAHGATTRL